MAKFRKEPVVAHRLGDDGWPDAIWEGVMENLIILHLARDAQKRVIGHAVIKTAHSADGKMRCEVGDWIVRGAKGFYSCKSAVAPAYETVLADG